MVRDQLGVLHRQVHRPELTDDDRSVTVPGCSECVSGAESQSTPVRTSGSRCNGSLRRCGYWEGSKLTWPGPTKTISRYLDGPHGRRGEHDKLIALHTHPHPLIARSWGASSGHLAGFPNPACLRDVTTNQLANHQPRCCQLASRIAEIGFVMLGTLTQCRTRWGTPTCRCHNDPTELHGPYRST